MTSPKERDMVPVFIRPGTRGQLVQLRGEVMARTGNPTVTYDDVINLLWDHYQKTRPDPNVKHLPEGPIVGGM